MKKYKNYKLSHLSHYKTGGFCDMIYFPETIQEVGEAVREIKSKNQEFFILGLGSNSLVLDQKWEGAVLCLKEMNKVSKLSENRILAEAGAVNSDVSEFALSESLAGLSWMYGLPGFIGATVRMNARCYGGEISQVVRKITTIDKEGLEKTYEHNPGNKDIFEAYKKTIFMANGEIVVAVEIELQPFSSVASIKAKMIECLEDRVSKGQYLKPSCGCVFKNNYGAEVSVPSGLLIDYCELRGAKKQGAMVSLQHANFINNEEEARSLDILELSLEVREKVWEKTGVWLEYEMEILGKPSAFLQKKIVEQREPRYNSLVLNNLRKKFHSR